MVMIVTGGSGYVGQNLLGALEERDQEYINIDIKEGDRNDIRDLDAMMERTSGGDVLVHLAALPDVQESISDPVRSHRVNINGTLNLLECARKRDIGTFVFISSFAAKDIQSPYGLQKFTGEEYCRLYSELHGIRTLVLRLSNLYGGPNYLENKESVIAVFTKQLHQGKDLTVFGGQQTRDFIHVDDVVSGIIGCLGSPRDFERYEISSGKETSIGKLAELFKKHKEGLDIEWLPYRKGEVMHSVGSPERAREDFGFSPTMELEEGIREQIEIMEGNPGEG